MDKAQNRLSRELENRVTTNRPTAWRPPETLPSPDPREGVTHRWVRTSMMGSADAANISSKLREVLHRLRTKNGKKFISSPTRFR